MVTLDTGALLKAEGHQVEYWGMKHFLNKNFRFQDLFIRNIDFDRALNFSEHLRASFNLLYSLEASNKLNKLLLQWKPDIVHLHNFAHQISPSILHILKKHNLPSVMTMHDYKLVCPSYSLLSQDGPCERCSCGKYFHCFLQKCVKKSRLKSLLNTVEMFLHHSILHIYENIDLFIAPSNFMKIQCTKMGMRSRIEVVRNFINLNSLSDFCDKTERTVVYVGRLSHEKGVEILIEIAKKLPYLSFKLIGDGPLRVDLERKKAEKLVSNLFFLGHLKSEDVQREVSKSLFVVLPSICYENNPKSIIESFAMKKPVIGSRLGGIPELVIDYQTGFTCQPGNMDDFVSKISFLVEHPELIRIMGSNARVYVENECSHERYYEKLLKMYQLTVDLHKSR